MLVFYSEYNKGNLQVNLNKLFVIREGAVEMTIRKCQIENINPPVVSFAGYLFDIDDVFFNNDEVFLGFKKKLF